MIDNATNAHISSIKENVSSYKPLYDPIVRKKGILFIVG